MNLPQIEPLGDQALLLRWTDSADIAANRQVHLLAKKLRLAAPSWLIDCVPAYASLAIFFDSPAPSGNDPAAAVRDCLLAMLEQPEPAADDTQSRLIEIPVCYGGDYGPDL